MTVLTQGRAPRPTAVALGLFDGVHLGHQAVLRGAAAHRGEGLLPAVFTFSAPSVAYKQHRPVQYLYTDRQKQQRLAAMGMELIYSPQFPETDMDTLITIVTRYHDQNTWKEDLIFTEDAFVLLENILKESKVLEDFVPYEDLVTTEFAEKAK